MRPHRPHLHPAPMTDPALGGPARYLTHRDAVVFSDSSPLGISRRVARLVFGAVETRNFAIRYWNSGLTEGGSSEPAFTLVLPDPGALRRFLLPPSQLRMARAFCAGDIDVEGDLIAATTMAAGLRAHLSSVGTLVDLYRMARRLPTTPAPAAPATEGRHRAATLRRRHSLHRDAAVVQQHYDLSNDFYRLWLDARMVYSCAYFDEGVTDINAAQTAKLHHICRKLRLRPGDRLLDIGCGWGGLIQLAAEAYGVTALGVTLSPAQAEEAQARIAAAGLADRCTVEVRDYRTITTDQTFDRIVSVGMCEHVGRSHLPEYFGHISGMLRPGGLFLNHCLTEGRSQMSRLERLFWREGVFLDRYIFPDSELPFLEELVDNGRRVGLEARDVEQLREHYVLTVRAWLARLTAARDAALRSVNSWTYRAWQLYLAGAAAGLAAGRMELTQVLYARPDADGGVPQLPLTRRDLYR